MKTILKRLSIAALTLLMCTGVASCGQAAQTGQTSQESVEAQTGQNSAEAQTGQNSVEAQTGQANQNSAEGQTAPGNPDDQTPDDQASAEDTKLVILHTNDMHGYMQASDSCLGIGAVAQLKEDYEKQGYDVLLMDAGDYLQGSAFANLTQGESVVKVMNAAGYDAVALGNHEF